MTPFLAENPDATKKTFLFATKNELPLHYVSASDGTNVVQVSILAETTPKS